MIKTAAEPHFDVLSRAPGARTRPGPLHRAWSARCGEVTAKVTERAAVGVFSVSFLLQRRMLFRSYSALSQAFRQALGGLLGFPEGRDHAVARPAQRGNDAVNVGWTIMIHRLQGNRQDHYMKHMVLRGVQPRAVVRSEEPSSSGRAETLLMVTRDEVGATARRKVTQTSK